jgi:uncharacterized protein
MTRDESLSKSDRLAADLRGFGPLGILAMIVILFTGNVAVGNMVVFPAGALLVIAWAWRSHTPWRAIGYVRSNNWPGTIAGAILLGCVLKLLLKALVMPLFGADPINRTYHFLAANRALLPAAVWAMLVAGFAEETVFRGYLFERSARWFGSGAPAKVLTVLVTAALFGMAHYADQGLTGAEQAAITGLVFGTIFAMTGNIFPVMFAHAAFDLTALAIIYWDLEFKVAHFVFR